MIVSSNAVRRRNNGSMKLEYPMWKEKNEMIQENETQKRSNNRRNMRTMIMRECS